MIWFGGWARRKLWMDFYETFCKWSPLEYLPWGQFWWHSVQCMHPLGPWSLFSKLCLHGGSMHSVECACISCFNFIFASSCFFFVFVLWIVFTCLLPCLWWWELWERTLWNEPLWNFYHIGHVRPLTCRSFYFFFSLFNQEESFIYSLETLTDWLTGEFAVHVNNHDNTALFFSFLFLDLILKTLLVHLSDKQMCYIRASVLHSGQVSPTFRWYVV